MSAYPFHKDSRLKNVHHSLLTHVHSSHFALILPSLSTDKWSLILSNPDERERLEFVGDRIIGAIVAQELYKLKPKQGPGFYTNALAVLVCNATFAHIMHRLGHYNIMTGIKPAGDAFETIMAAYKQESGQEAFETYVRDSFRPLIWIVCRSYDKARALHTIGNKKTNNHPLVSRSWTKSKAPQDPKPRYMSPSTRRRDSLPVIIDLTLDDDDDAHVQGPQTSQASSTSRVPSRHYLNDIVHVIAQPSLLV
ncbi:hypothetical protein CVT24_000541 [Panaeolus cyanescens]|uniref:RNase III domain-containing protein n=1 Tax=Panaeolus cyanescens TaxID=181874 RepID=A0A409VE26_9AGAR|nr:hypothetical protein CVT24_000541 [Panaeolus cyanescens]